MWCWRIARRWGRLEAAAFAAAATATEVGLLRLVFYLLHVWVPGSRRAVGPLGTAVLSSVAAVMLYRTAVGISRQARAYFAAERDYARGRVMALRPGADRPADLARHRELLRLEREWELDRKSCAAPGRGGRRYIPAAGVELAAGGAIVTLVVAGAAALAYNGAWPLSLPCLAFAALVARGVADAVRQARRHRHAERHDLRCRDGILRSGEGDDALDAMHDALRRLRRTVGDL